MSATSGVVIMTGEEETAKAVSDALASRSRLTPQSVSRDYSGLIADLERTEAAAALIDIDAKPQEMLKELESVVNRFKHVRFVVLSSEIQSDWVLQAMQAGARHYVVKSSIPIELAGALERLIPNGYAGKESRGAIVSVLSASGGCGATTLAANLAHELGMDATAKTLLIDMDLCYGAAASFLGLEAQYGLAEVIADGERIDSDLIKSTVQEAGENVEVLLSPATPNPSEPVRLDMTHLPRLLRVAGTMYDAVVIDAPRVPLDVAATLADLSTATLLVFQLNVIDLRTVKSMMTGLVQRGVSGDSIIPVISRYRKRRMMISLEDAQRALGDIHIGMLSNDYQSAITSINYGQPLAQCAPRSALRRDIRSLASSIQHAHKEGSRVREW